jgi:hypothetical protein
MLVTKSGTVGVMVLVLLLAGCSFPKNSADKAEWFFEKGHDKIVDSLEGQGVEGEEMERVKAVLAEHRSPVVSDLTVAFSEHRTGFKTLYSGGDTSSLLSSEGQASRAKRESLRSIGAMHADIEQVVGADTWAAANEQRRKRFEDRFED